MRERCRGCWVVGGVLVVGADWFTMDQSHSSNLVQSTSSIPTPPFAYFLDRLVTGFVAHSHLAIHHSFPTIQSPMTSKLVVLDNGTGYVKAGFAGQNFPTSTFPSAIGRPILRASESAVDGRSKAKTIKEHYIGDEVLLKGPSLTSHIQ